MANSERARAFRPQSPGITRRVFPTFLTFLICIALSCLLESAVAAAPAQNSGACVQISAAPLIWDQQPSPPPGTVVLFRRQLELATAADELTLQIFADTRYELWLDGEWLGRGPARFSQKRREYDVYTLAALKPGRHTVAALVQWAPNVRRSESVRPGLQMRLIARTGAESRTLDCTGSHWQVSAPGAWDASAVPVHSWGLVGPAELLDLGRLPDGWTKSDFDATGWPSATLQPGPAGIYQPRSIPLTAEYPIAAAVLARGRLSPGSQLLEFDPHSGPQRLAFYAPAGSQLRLDGLDVLDRQGALFPIGELVAVNGDRLEWQGRADWHPDRRQAVVPLAEGINELIVGPIPDTGVTLQLTPLNFALPDWPMQPSVQSGRRLLLPDLAPAEEAVQIVSARPDGRQVDGFAVTFLETPGYLLLDLGRTVHGRLYAQVSGPAGTVVDVGWDERIHRWGRPLPYAGTLNPPISQVDSWVLDGGQGQMATIDARAGRYVLIAVWGDGPVSLTNLRVREERYPFGQQATFASTNPLLDRIWQVGVDSLLPNATDAFTDTPWRERGQWWGDAFVMQHIARAAFNDTQLLRRGLVQVADEMGGGRPAAMAPHTSSAGRMLDFGLVWVESLYDYWQISGDLATVQVLFPQVQAFFVHLQSLTADSGLLDIPPGHWSETALIDWLGAPSRAGQSTAINSMYYGGLVRASALAQAVGNPEAAAAYAARAEQVRAAVNRELFQPEAGQYLSSIVNGQAVPATPHAQAWPLAYGLVPAQEEARVTQALLEQISFQPGAANVGLYGTFWVLEALGRMGRLRAGVKLIENHFGYMLQRGATTWWENFRADAFPGQSYSHGWGGSPSWFLSGYVLGAERTGPMAWRVQWGGDLYPRVAGAVPLAVGQLAVERLFLGCEQRELRLDVPANASGAVSVPLGPAVQRVALDGAEVWPQALAGARVRADGDVLEIEFPALALARSHRLAATSRCQELYFPFIQAGPGLAGQK